MVTAGSEPAGGDRWSGGEQLAAQRAAYRHTRVARTFYVVPLIAVFVETFSPAIGAFGASCALSPQSGRPCLGILVSRGRAAMLYRRSLPSARVLRYQVFDRRAELLGRERFRED